MAKMRKSGLHKDISTIFDGVPLPNENGQLKSCGSSVNQSSAGHIPPESKVVSGGIAQNSSNRSKTGILPKTMATQGVSKRSSFAGINKYLDQIKTKLFAPQPGVNPAKQKMMAALMPILIVVAVFVLGRNFMGSGNKNKQQDSLLTPAAASAKKEINWQRPAAYPDNLRDPMTKYTAQTNTDVTTDKSDIVVKGIVWSSDNPSAIIGTEILYIGDSVQDAKITKITRESVEFQRDDKTWSQKVAGY